MELEEGKVRVLVQHLDPSPMYTPLKAYKKKQVEPTGSCHRQIPYSIHRGRMHQRGSCCLPPIDEEVVGKRKLGGEKEKGDELEEGKKG